MFETPKALEAETKQGNGLYQYEYRTFLTGKITRKAA
jgi:hypothetical protein